MALNWKELDLLLSEMPLKDSFIQDITEHSVHSFTLSLFNNNSKSWLMYVEIATPHSRICMTNHMRKKSQSMQRFTQYMKAHIRGKRIVDIIPLKYDRAFFLILQGHEEQYKMLFRLYSGPGANIIVLDSNNTILELLFRRPKRDEVKGKTLLVEEKTEEGKAYSVRPFSTPTFNEYIDERESESDKEEKRDEYLSILEERKNKSIAESLEKERKLNERLKKTENYEETKKAADLFSTSLYLYKKGMDNITLHDWESDKDVTISLDKTLSATENLSKLYERYRKDKTTYTLALGEKEKCIKEREEIISAYNSLLSSPFERIKKAVNGDKVKEEKLIPGRAGLYVKSHDWLLIVGRNAKENDQILRTSTRGSDIWLHTRDFAGGYVIIKAQKDKTVPLPVLLDAAYLAIFFSKARKNNKADLYYTYVKYLKRIKGAKLGLIIPTQEKNLTVTLDEERVRKLLE